MPRLGPRGSARATLIVVLAGAGASWNAGNLGAVVGDVGNEFDLSLGAVGLLSGTVLFASAVAGNISAPRVAERHGVVRTLLLAALLGGAGNLLFALAPSVEFLTAGRVLAGLGFGFAAVAGPVYARATGGVARVGLFGAAFQLGIAGGLGAGALLADLGVDWRVSFLLSALVALALVPLLRGAQSGITLERRGGGFLRIAARSARVWRLTALFVTIFGLPLILGAWLVHFLSVDSGLAVGLAGGLGFLLFGISALMREVGGKLSARGGSPALLAGVPPLLAAAGLAALAFDDGAAVATLAVIAIGAGVAMPYSVAVVEAERLLPGEPAEPVALMTLLGTVAPIPAIPLIGGLLDGGDGEAVFLVLAGFAAAAGLANLRPVEGPLSSDPARGSPGGAEPPGRDRA